MSTPIGSICHNEIFARDLAESAKFYGDLFGWNTSPQDAGYLSWKDTAGNSGGFTTAGAPITNPAATFYIKVEDIPAMLEKITRHGGVIIRQKTDIGGNYGFYALFRDLAGNNVGLWCGK
ncbi:MAG: VOC family protein [Candidatus Hatepunaea meridiana]|nr:VOC family protein [Candidatus Hatepunaea meridiana]